MKDENRSSLIKYLVCFAIASAIAVGVFAINGFFTDSIAINLRILSDGFTVAGMMFLFAAGMLFISGEGALLGISFVLRNVVMAFVPMGRKHHETYKDYRERKVGELKKRGDKCIFLTGLAFLLIGIVLIVILYTNFYDISVIE